MAHTYTSSACRSAKSSVTMHHGMKDKCKVESCKAFPTLAFYRKLSTLKTGCHFLFLSFILCYLARANSSPWFYEDQFKLE
ncbi:hypothetical protein Mapa_004134 [Marchantia paleacea]|nr:hypothetical protein Mapa_004134 [Marchantia paleacea]